MNIWQGKKVNLRAMEPSDWEIFFNKSNLDTELQRNVDEIWFPISKEAQKEWAEKMSKKHPENDNFSFVIENKNGDVVGSIDSHHCNRKIGCFMYGIDIFEEHRRKGYASEAVFLLLRYFFRELGYQKITVEIHSFNGESINLHEKLGFIHEGRIRKNVFTNGQFFDTVIYGMTVEEFQGKFFK